MFAGTRERELPGDGMTFARMCDRFFSFFRYVGNRCCPACRFGMLEGWRWGSSFGFGSGSGDEKVRSTVSTSLPPASPSVRRPNDMVFVESRPGGQASEVAQERPHGSWRKWSGVQSVEDLAASAFVRGSLVEREAGARSREDSFHLRVPSQVLCKPPKTLASS